MDLFKCQNFGDAKNAAQQAPIPTYPIDRSEGTEVVLKVA